MALYGYACKRCGNLDHLFADCPLPQGRMKPGDPRWPELTDLQAKEDHEKRYDALHPGPSHSVTVGSSASPPTSSSAIVRGLIARDILAQSTASLSTSRGGPSVAVQSLANLSPQGKAKGKEKEKIYESPWAPTGPSVNTTQPFIASPETTDLKHLEQATTPTIDVSTNAAAATDSARIDDEGGVIHIVTNNVEVKVVLHELFGYELVFHKSKDLELEQHQSGEGKPMRIDIKLIPRILGHGASQGTMAPGAGKASPDDQTVTPWYSISMWLVEKVFIGIVNGCAVFTALILMFLWFCNYVWFLSGLKVPMELDAQRRYLVAIAMCLWLVFRGLCNWRNNTVFPWYSRKTWLAERVSIEFVDGCAAFKALNWVTIWVCILEWGLRGKEIETVVLEPAAQRRYLLGIDIVIGLWLMFRGCRNWPNFYQQDRLGHLVLTFNFFAILIWILYFARKCCT